MRTWITDVRYTALKGMAEVCEKMYLTNLGPGAGRCEGGIRPHTQYHVEEFGFSQYIVREGEGGGAITFTCFGMHCKLFAVEDFVVGVHQPWRKK